MKALAVAFLMAGFKCCVASGPQKKWNMAGYHAPTEQSSVSSQEKLHMEQNLGLQRDSNASKEQGGILSVHTRFRYTVFRETCLYKDFLKCSYLRQC